MAKHKGDIEIGKRAAEEVYRVFNSVARGVMALGCHKSDVYAWMDGATPGGFMLARLHYHGCDVLYILTGKRHNDN